MPADKYNKFPDIHPKKLNSNEYYSQIGTDNSKYNIIKLQIIKQRLFALTKNKDNYFLLTGLTETPKLDVNIKNDLLDTDIISCERHAEISIPFMKHNNSLFSIIGLHNEEEYNTIIKVAEVIL